MCVDVKFLRYVRAGYVEILAYKHPIRRDRSCAKRSIINTLPHTDTTKCHINPKGWY